MGSSSEIQQEAWLIVVESAKNALASIENENYRTIKQMSLGSILYAFEMLDFDLTAAHKEIDPSEKMSRAEAATYIGVEMQTLANWASTGKVKIPFHKIGRKVTYIKQDLDEYLASSKMSETP